VAANDGLNAALSGSKAKDLPSQVKSTSRLSASLSHNSLTIFYFHHLDYLLPSLKSLDVQEDEWKLLTLSIGANDVVSTQTALRSPDS
jgi:hypothetical protein